MTRYMNMRVGLFLVFLMIWAVLIGGLAYKDGYEAGVEESNERWEPLEKAFARQAGQHYAEEPNP